MTSRVAAHRMSLHIATQTRSWYGVRRVRGSGSRMCSPAPTARNRPLHHGRRNQYVMVPKTRWIPTEAVARAPMWNSELTHENLWGKNLTKFHSCSRRFAQHHCSTTFFLRLARLIIQARRLCLVSRRFFVARALATIQRVTALS